MDVVYRNGHMNASFTERPDCPYDAASIPQVSEYARCTQPHLFDECIDFLNQIIRVDGGYNIVYRSLSHTPDFVDILVFR